MRARKPSLVLRARPYLILGLLLLIWEVTAHSGLVDPKFLPSLEAVAARGWAEAGDGNMASDLLASLRRDMTGFVVGASLGLSFGMLMGFSARWMRSPAGAFRTS